MVDGSHSACFGAFCKGRLLVNLKISGQITGLATIPKTCIAKHAPLSIMNKPILIMDDDRPGRLALRLLFAGQGWETFRPLFSIMLSQGAFP